MNPANTLIRNIIQVVGFVGEGLWMEGICMCSVGIHVVIIGNHKACDAPFFRRGK